MERLFDGTQRYGDQQHGLGKGTNMLAARLREFDVGLGDQPYSGWR